MSAEQSPTSLPFDAARIAKAVRQRLQSLQRSGITSIRSPNASQTDLSSLQNQLANMEQNRLPTASRSKNEVLCEDERVKAEDHVGEVAPKQIPPASVPTPSLTLNISRETAVMPSKKQSELDIVCQEVANCTACTELASTRAHTVFGVGNPNARLVFYGEAPGAEEDKQGEPFVGRAGKLLNKIIEAMGLTRDEIYILNTIKCRPPGNRNPTPDEQQNCADFLKRQLEIIQPEYIVCLGAIASHSFLECKTPIGKMRGQFFDKNGIKVLCTFHPAYLLRDPRRKRDVWDDIQFLMKDMGLTVPKNSEGVT
ncbi:MAG: uracil-DNA glycosylase [Rhodopirellula sp.]|nr:uracil-DNA glycosylase [Rhodopirellula sp.]